MDKKTVGRVVGLILVTALLAASITTMYVGLARYDAMWFWSTVAGYVILLFLVLFIFRIRADEADAAVSASGRGPSSGTSGLLAAASLPDAPFEVQKATGMLPVERALEMGKPAGFVFRGFTLYERAVAGKMSRAFAKKVPAGATAITLPTGYEATWDPKKREPKLVRLVDEEAEVVIERGAGKPCSAWNSPGEICENVAVGGTQYCKKHANYRGGMEWGGVETRIARRDTKGGAFRSATPTMEVITAKPRAKPFTVKIPTVEVHLDRRLAKPVKFGRASEPEVRLARGKPMKPLRFGKPKVDVRVARRETPKPLRLGQPDVAVRGSKPKAAKPLRWGQPQLDVRDARPKAAKPLRLSEPKIDVKDSRPQPGKPLRLKEPNLDIREPAAPSARPLKVGEPKLEIRSGAMQKAKPLRVAEPQIEVRVAKPKAKKPLDLGDMSNVEVVSGAAKKTDAFRALKPSGEILVVKDTRARSSVGVPPEASKKRRA